MSCKEIYIDKEKLKNFEKLSESSADNNKELNMFVKYLEDERLIFNTKIMNKPMNYNNLNLLNQNILNSFSNNKVFIIHIEETRQLVFKPLSIDKKLEYLVCGFMKWFITNFPLNEIFESSVNFIIISYIYIKDIIEIENKESDFENDTDEDGWFAVEYESDSQNVTNKETKSNEDKRIEIESIFKCSIKYECEMAIVYSDTINIKEAINKYIKTQNNNEKEWTIDNLRFLKYLYDNHIYNVYDLKNKCEINKIKTTLSNDDNKGLRNKLNKLIKYVEDENITNNSKIKKNTLNGLEVTRNGCLLQQALPNEYVYNTLIFTYNPLQNCIITPTINKHISHPIDIYANAYSSTFDYYLSEYQLHKLYLPLCDLLFNITILIRYNKKYEILLVPSSIYLNELFLQSECKQIAHNHESIGNHRLTFIYKGMIYLYPSQKVEESDDTISGFSVDERKELEQKLLENIIIDPQSHLHYDSYKWIRNTIIYNQKNTIIRWLRRLRIGCGSCFIHTNDDSDAEEILYESENQFSNELRKTMIIRGIDLQTIPYNALNCNYLDIIHYCSLCNTSIICIYDIGNNKCSHKFCVQCILKNDNKHCPLYKECNCEIIKIKQSNNNIDNNYCIPFTIKKQLKQQNTNTYNTILLSNPS
eukprot:442270_1